MLVFLQLIQISDVKLAATYLYLGLKDSDSRKDSIDNKSDYLSKNEKNQVDSDKSLNKTEKWIVFRIFKVLFIFLIEKIRKNKLIFGSFITLLYIILKLKFHK